MDPLKCRQCNTKVGNIDSICCSAGSVWHHLKCSGLNEEEFSKHTKSNNLHWVCPKCTIYRCASCVKIIGKRQDSILCNLCKNWIYRKCSPLGKCDFEKIGQIEEPWFCLGCRQENLPFLTLDTQKFNKLFEIPKTAKNKDNQGVQLCRICDKKNYHACNDIKCIYCKHMLKQMF